MKHFMNILQQQSYNTNLFKTGETCFMHFFTFFVHAEDTILKMALGLAGSPVEIAAWHDAERAPKAYNRASLHCHSKNWFSILAK